MLAYSTVPDVTQHCIVRNSTGRGVPVQCVIPSEFRRSLRVLHTRTDVRVDTRTSGDVEFLVPVSAWELGYFRGCTELVMYLHFGVFTQTLRYSFN